MHLASEITIDDLEWVVMVESCTNLESESGGDDMDPEPARHKVEKKMFCGNWFGHYKLETMSL